MSEVLKAAGNALAGSIDHIFGRKDDEFSKAYCEASEKVIGGMFSNEFVKQLAVETDRATQLTEECQWVESSAPRKLALNKQDALMVIADFGLTVEDTENYYNAAEFVSFKIGDSNSAYLDLRGGDLYLWSGMGEHFDYGADFRCKTPERLTDILKVLTSNG